MNTYQFQGLATAPGYALVVASNKNEARDKVEKGKIEKIVVEGDASDFVVNDDDGPQLIAGTEPLPAATGPDEPEYDDSELHMQWKRAVNMDETTQGLDEWKANGG